MTPYELTPQDKDALSDYPDWVPPKIPPPGCPCNRYATCKECVEAMRTTKELVDELSKREGVEQFIVDPEDSYKLSIGYSLAKTTGIKEDTGPARIIVVID